MRGAIKVAVARGSRASSPARPVEILVPRTFYAGGLDGVPPGAGIAGIWRRDGLVAIEYRALEFVVPALHTWSIWVADAASRLLRDEPECEPTLVSERELIPVGWYWAETIRIEDGARRALWSWIDAGRDAFELSHESVA